MIIEPKIRGFLCTTAHPVGCRASVEEQIRHIRAGGQIAGGPRKALIIGSSTGYGLASRIAAANTSVSTCNGRTGNAPSRSVWHPARALPATGTGCGDRRAPGSPVEGRRIRTSTASPAMRTR